MQFNQMMYDRQPQTKTAMQACIGTITLAQAVKDKGQEIRSNAATVSIT
jgi:hypothetical protein